MAGKLSVYRGDPAEAEESEEGRMNGNVNTEIQPSCENCLYEYTCSWEPAGEKSCCENCKEE